MKLYRRWSMVVVAGAMLVASSAMAQTKQFPAGTKNRGAAQDATAEGGGRVVLRKNASAPSLVFAHARRDPFPDLERLNQDVLRALQKYDTLFDEAMVLTKGNANAIRDPRALDAKYRYDTINSQLVRAIDQAWRRLPRLNQWSGNGALVDEHLRFFFFVLQSRIQDKAGPLHTRVIGLSNDARCRGDLVQDQLLYRYGKAMSSPRSFLVDDGANAAAQELADMQRQFVCLGAPELDAFSRELRMAYTHVVKRMTQEGFGSLRKAFTEQLLPVQLLLWDTNKQRGKRWFVENAASMTQWPTPLVKVYSPRKTKCRV